jgi:hypothetical protein
MPSTLVKSDTACGTRMATDLNKFDGLQKAVNNEQEYPQEVDYYVA